MKIYTDWSHHHISDPKSYLLFWKCLRWSCLKAVSGPTSLTGGLLGSTETSALVLCMFVNNFVNPCCLTKKCRFYDVQCVDSSHVSPPNPLVGVYIFFFAYLLLVGEVWWILIQSLERVRSVNSTSPAFEIDSLEISLFLSLPPSLSRSLSLSLFLSLSHPTHQ